MAGRNFNQKRNTVQNTNQNTNQPEALTQKSLDMLVNNIFAKNGVKAQNPRLSARDKQELQGLLRDLQASVENLTKRNTGNQ